MRITFSIQSFVVAFFLILVFAVPVFAMDLHEARAQGMVGERADGYAEALSKAGGVSALVADVNSKRRAEYARIARDKSQPMAVVGKLAAVEIIKGLSAGESYMGDDGSWKKR